jgi:hypothetical protein
LLCRHGGPLPCDEDLDIVFPAWLNLIGGSGADRQEECTDATVPTLRGYEHKDENALLLCGYTRKEYVPMAAQFLKRRLPVLSSPPGLGLRKRRCEKCEEVGVISPTDFGGLKVNLAGIDIDMVVSILDRAYIQQGPVCRCMFGDTDAACLEGARAVLDSVYGLHAGDGGGGAAARVSQFDGAMSHDLAIDQLPARTAQCMKDEETLQQTRDEALWRTSALVTQAVKEAWQVAHVKHDPNPDPEFGAAAAAVPSHGEEASEVRQQMAAHPEARRLS